MNKELSNKLQSLKEIHKDVPWDIRNSTSFNEYYESHVEFYSSDGLKPEEPYKGEEPKKPFVPHFYIRWGWTITFIIGLVFFIYMILKLEYDSFVGFIIPLCFPTIPMVLGFIGIVDGIVDYKKNKKSYPKEMEEYQRKMKDYEEEYQRKMEEYKKEVEEYEDLQRWVNNKEEQLKIYNEGIETLNTLLNKAQPICDECGYPISRLFEYDSDIYDVADLVERGSADSVKEADLILYR